MPATIKRFHITLLSPLANLFFIRQAVGHMTLPPLLRPSYWFAFNPPPFLPGVDRALLVLFLILLVGGVAVGLVALRDGWEKLTRRALKAVSGRLVILGVVGLLLYGLHYERTPILSMRFGYVLWLALAAWFVWKTYQYVWVELPEMAERHEARERISKWLPKRKT